MTEPAWVSVQSLAEEIGALLESIDGKIQETYYEDEYQEGMFVQEGVIKVMPPGAVEFTPEFTPEFEIRIRRISR